VLTTNKLWHMAVAAMSLASGRPMRAFDDERAAAAGSWDRRRLNVAKAPTGSAPASSATAPPSGERGPRARRRAIQEALALGERSA